MNHDKEGEGQTCNYSTRIHFSSFVKTSTAYIYQARPFKTMSEDISTQHPVQVNKKGKLPPQITYILYKLSNTSEV